MVSGMPATLEEQGYAMQSPKSGNETQCVSAPIFDKTDRVIAYLSISGPEQQFPKNLPIVIEDVVVHAKRISRKMGWREDNIRYFE